MNRSALAAGATISLLLAVVLWRSAGPAPEPQSAPAGHFSAARAGTIISQLLAENVPHPVGSAANARVRDRIVARLRDLGYPVTIQRRFVCNARPACATVENIVAIPPGDGDVILLVAHYDSVPAGPGASDDTAGVAAILETLRALRGERLRNRIGVLITDGEEAGLLGAEAFVADPGLTRDVRVVVNAESRGTSGPAFLFETSRNNRGLISAAASALPRPFASSLFYTIYARLPNDTDVSVFKRAGLGAMNFASIGDVVWYHTPLDDVGHIDRRTLQHHGDNVLSLARELGRRDLTREARGDAVYFDVLGFFLAWWPQRWTIVLATLAALALIPALRHSSFSAIWRGTAAFFAAILVASLLGTVLMIGFRSRLIFPQPLLIAASAAAIASAIAAGTLLRNSEDDIQPGIAAAWVTLALVLAILLPGVSFLFLIPAAGMVAATFIRNPVLRGVAAAAAAAVALLPLGSMAYEALGSMALPGVALTVALLATTALHDLRGWRVAALFLLAAIVATGIAALLPRATAERPAHVSIAYELDADRHTAAWVARDREQPAPFLSLASPAITAARDGEMVRVTIRSTADALAVTFPAAASVESVNGVRPAAPTRRRRSRSETVAMVRTGSATIDVRSRGALRVTVETRRYGLPAPPPAAVARRATETPVQSGDVTVVRRTVSVN